MKFQKKKMKILGEKKQVEKKFTLKEKNKKN